MKSKYILSTIFLASIASADIGTTKMWQLDSKASKYPYINIADKASSAFEKGNDYTREGLEKLDKKTKDLFKKK